MNDYKYLAFIEQPTMTKTKIFAVINKSSKSVLGFVKWYGPWRKYCFVTVISDLVFDTGCLADIQDFINRLMAERKK